MWDNPTLPQLMTDFLCMLIRPDEATLPGATAGDHLSLVAEDLLAPWENTGKEIKWVGI